MFDILDLYPDDSAKKVVKSQAKSSTGLTSFYEPTLLPDEESIQTSQRYSQDVILPREMGYPDLCQGEDCFAKRTVLDSGFSDNIDSVCSSCEYNDGNPFFHTSLERSYIHKEAKQELNKYQRSSSSSFQYGKTFLRKDSSNTHEKADSLFPYWIFGDNKENWFSLREAPTWARFLGRAFAAPSRSAREPCTYWLAGHNLLVGAAHCRADLRIGSKISGKAGLQLNRSTGGCPLIHKDVTKRVESSKKIEFLFGIKQGASLDSTKEKMFADEVIQEARERMIDLGIPKNNVVRYQNEDLNSFTCGLHDTSYRQYDGCRDVDYYRCDHKQLKYTSFGSVYPDELFSIFPGAIYGRIPIDFYTRQGIYPTYLRKGEKYSVISRNEKSKDEGTLEKPMHLLFSPLGEIDNVDPKRLFFQGDGAYVAGGSSGGPALDSRRKTAIGVLSQTWDAAGHPDLDEYATIPLRILRYSPQWPQNALSQNKKELNRISYNSRQIGVGSFRDRVRLSCPSGYAVAGIVSSTINDLVSPRLLIGSFGLVCLPYSSTYQFEHAVVITGGSSDTSEFSSEPLGTKHRPAMPFNRYMVKHFSSGRIGMPNSDYLRSVILKPQSFKMCPPNYFLQNLSVVERLDSQRNTSSIQSVRKLGCRRFDYTKSAFPVSPRLPMGDSRILSSEDRAETVTQCPLGSFIVGMDVWVNQYTRAFRFLCGTPLGVGSIPLRKYDTCEPWDHCKNPNNKSETFPHFQTNAPSLLPDVSS